MIIPAIGVMMRMNFQGVYPRNGLGNPYFFRDINFSWNCFYLGEVEVFWLVVEPPLWKNISQLGSLFPIYGKKMFQTTNQKIIEACVSRHVVQVSALGSCLLCSSVLFQHVRHVTKNLWWSSIPASARENCLSVASNASLFPRITATQV